jgi:phage shock protein A
MGIFDRFSTLLRSNINDLISRAEDPEKMLNQILVDMRSQLAKAKQQVATAIADEKRLRDQAMPSTVRRPTGSRRQCSRSRKVATISPSRR